MRSIPTTIAIALLLFAAAAAAGDGKRAPKRHDYDVREDLFEYASVLDVQPILREVRVSKPVRECWDEPVYQTRQQHGSAGGMLAGGLIGGIIGSQFGSGRGNKVATAMGTLIGAQIGQQAANGHGQSEQTLAGYEEHCRTRHEVNYEQVVDGYDVTYEYRGREYQIVMPYDPGRHIKMRIQFTPVI
jgi:uncharacterized protein YcfJ